MKSRRSLGKTLAGLAVSLVGAYALAELAVRVFNPLDVLVYQDSEDPALAFELRPGVSGMKNGVEVSISSQGLRDDVVPPEVPPGERRVVVVGGYETFGIGVPAEQTFVRELPDGLSDRGEKPVRAINLSMYSYHMSQKVELACRRLKDLQPQWAVLQVTDGDNNNPRPALLNFPRLKNWIRARSALARWASERRYLRPLPPARSGKPEDLTPVAENVRRFKECAAAAGARAAVIVLPDLSRPDAAAPTSFQKAVEAAAKEDGLPVLNGGPALMSVAEDQRLAIPKQAFPSPAAHRALSDAVRKWLKPLLRVRPPAKAPPRRPLA
jgi:hypothetical protein